MLHLLHLLHQPYHMHTMLAVPELCSKSRGDERTNLDRTYPAVRDTYISRERGFPASHVVAPFSTSMADSGEDDGSEESDFHADNDDLDNRHVPLLLVLALLIFPGTNVRR